LICVPCPRPRGHVRQSSSACPRRRGHGTQQKHHKKRPRDGSDSISPQVSSRLNHLASCLSAAAAGVTTPPCVVTPNGTPARRLLVREASAHLEVCHHQIRLCHSESALVILRSAEGSCRKFSSGVVSRGVEARFFAPLRMTVGFALNDAALLRMMQHLAPNHPGERLARLPQLSKNLTSLPSRYPGARICQAK
jgi:hypothetical protein